MLLRIRYLYCLHATYSCLNPTFLNFILSISSFFFSSTKFSLAPFPFPSKHLSSVEASVQQAFHINQ